MKHYIVLTVIALVSHNARGSEEITLFNNFLDELSKEKKQEDLKHYVERENELINQLEKCQQDLNTNLKTQKSLIKLSRALGISIVLETKTDVYSRNLRNILDRKLGKVLALPFNQIFIQEILNEKEAALQKEAYILNIHIKYSNSLDLIDTSKKKLEINRGKLELLSDLPECLEHIEKDYTDRIFTDFIILHQKEEGNFYLHEMKRLKQEEGKKTLTEKHKRFMHEECNQKKKSLVEKQRLINMEIALFEKAYEQTCRKRALNKRN